MAVKRATFIKKAPLATVRKNLIVFITALSLLTVLTVRPVSATTIFNLSDTTGTLSLVGTITTDGTLGVLAFSNIVDWNLTVSGNGSPVTITPANTIDANLIGSSLSGYSAYPGDAASPANIAAWMSARAVQAGIPPELPVMAALVDSGLRNLNFGDADAVGFFQMRESIWNNGPYAGFPDQPELQIKWFLDQAAAVRAARIAAGDVTFGSDPLTWGEWVADVQRPPEQFRGRYQLRLADARTLVAVSATATDLLWDYSNPSASQLVLADSASQLVFAGRTGSNLGNVAWNNATFSLFLDSGAGIEFEASNRSGVQSIGSAAPPAVPEPSTLGLIGLGLLGLGAMRRRRRCS